MRHFRSIQSMVSLRLIFAGFVLASVSPALAQVRVTRGPMLAPARIITPPGALLTPDDHNEVVKAAMDHYKQIAQKLNLKARKQQGRSKPTEREIFAAMLQISEVPLHAKQIIQKTLQVLPILENTQQRRSVAAKRTLEEIERQLASAQTTGQVIQKLQEMGRSRSFTDAEDIGARISFAEEMIRKGTSTIYSPNYQFYKDLKGSNPGGAAKSVKDGDIVKADVKGAMGGGVEGAISESVKEVLSQVWDAIVSVIL